MADTPKPIATAQIVLSALGLLKTVGLVFFMALLDYARRQKALAEKAAAVAQSDLKVEKHKQEVANETHGKAAADIVREFIDGQGG